LNSSSAATASQVLFLGELPFWLKISQSIVEVPSTSFQVHRSASLRDALHRMHTEDWHALLVDLSHPSAQELLVARKLVDRSATIPLIALLPIADLEFESAALGAGAASSLLLDHVNSGNLEEAVRKAIHGTKSKPSREKEGSMYFAHGPISPDRAATKIELFSHALNNLLCVINANADILADQLDPAHNAARSVSQIKKATKTAVDLMRHLQTP
jgi:DNA-binding NtrC family response regulator